MSYVYSNILTVIVLYQYIRKRYGSMSLSIQFYLIILVTCVCKIESVISDKRMIQKEQLFFKKYTKSIP